MKGFIKEVDQVDGAVPGAVIAITSFVDFFGYNPHAHILIAVKFFKTAFSGFMDEDAPLVFTG